MVRVVRVKPLDVVTRNYAERSLIAFLEGKKNLNWIVGVIRSSGVRGERLLGVFNRLANHRDKPRYQQAFLACKNLGLFESQS